MSANGARARELAAAVVLAGGVCALLLPVAAQADDARPRAARRDRRTPTRAIPPSSRCSSQPRTGASSRCARSRTPPGWTNLNQGRPYRLVTGNTYTLVLIRRDAPYTLDDLLDYAPSTFVRQPDGSYLLSENIVIEQGATLRLSSKDGLRAAPGEHPRRVRLDRHDRRRSRVRGQRRPARGGDQLGSGRRGRGYRDRRRTRLPARDRRPRQVRPRDVREPRLLVGGDRRSRAHRNRCAGRALRRRRSEPGRRHLDRRRGLRHGAVPGGRGGAARLRARPRRVQLRLRRHRRRPEPEQRLRPVHHEREGCRHPRIRRSRTISSTGSCCTAG